MLPLPEHPQRQIGFLAVVAVEINNLVVQVGNQF
jgi:hypothetical protein